MFSWHMAVVPFSTSFVLFVVDLAQGVFCVVKIAVWSRWVHGVADQLLVSGFFVLFFDGITLTIITSITLFLFFCIILISVVD
ncbi:hypothetical protein BGW36DRAFT_384875 [Talaromyces proteolyticus]|uniref:Uncharacterized protein n=1 Tax=Talaromyces proteolyticus TaxID=1131652 RepID=A0AAD4PWM0_9EURO|nr:uncharacterized protein BGW36DRAFT_384875 [Talaromyces proteolyticus]KAH8692642.1 hypothetical protein BGW36DRAFT_384875 [Talaromyces proteolyticus]